jgi:hypothetical protein
VPKLPDSRVISPPWPFKKTGLDGGQGQVDGDLGQFLFEFPTGKKYGLASRNFEKKIVFIEKDDEITRIEGIYLLHLTFFLQQNPTFFSNASRPKSPYKVFK